PGTRLSESPPRANTSTSSPSLPLSASASSPPPLSLSPEAPDSSSPLHAATSNVSASKTISAQNFGFMCFPPLKILKISIMTARHHHIDDMQHNDCCKLSEILVLIRCRQPLHRGILYEMHTLLAGLKGLEHPPSG